MNAELCILQILESASPYPVSRSVLGSEMALRDRTETSREIDAALRSMDGADVDGVTNKDAPGGSRWTITDQGKLRLANANL